MTTARFSAQTPEEIRTDLLVLGTGSNWRAGIVARLDRRLGNTVIAEITAQGFHGTQGEMALYQTHGALPARNLLFVGLDGADIPKPWYTLADAAINRGRALRAGSAAIALTAARWSAHAVEWVAEGLRLASYSFDRMKSAPRKAESSLQHVSLLVGDASAELHQALLRGEAIAAATCYARDLVNLPAAVVTPTYLANEAKRIARAQHLRVRIMEPVGLRRAGMEALLAVAQGSAQPPRFIELVYDPRPATRPTRARRCIALAGKGITFDSGGLSIKPAEAMQSQKRDMAGGAAVLAVMSALRDLELPVVVHGYIAAAENMPGGRAIKPGDVVRAANGKTIEVLNTDAEGRLVLADALSYASAAHPDVLIDLATLTGAVRTALGSRYAGIMGTDAGVVQALITAARQSGENLWELPLAAEYRPDIDSQIADLKNIGDGSAGTIIGGLFLREFVGVAPWAHIDFSSTATTEKAFACHPRGATGFGVRTMLRYLMALR